MTTENLTHREIQCLQLAAWDKSLKETANSLCLSLSMIKKYRGNILQKLHCHTFTGALAIALKNQWISL